MRCLGLIAILCAFLLPAVASAQWVGTTPSGQPVTVYTGAGAVAAQVTVLEVIDPFQDWADYLGPQADQRYVVATVQIDATGERPFAFEAHSFMLMDSLGRLYWSGFPFRSPASTVQMPDLEGTSMLPGETVTGALSFTVPVDAEIVQVVYLAYPEDTSLLSSQHLYLLADLTASPTPAA